MCPYYNRNSGHNSSSSSVRTNIALILLLQVYIRSLLFTLTCALRSLRLSWRFLVPLQAGSPLSPGACSRSVTPPSSKVPPVTSLKATIAAPSCFQGNDMRQKRVRMRLDIAASTASAAAQLALLLLLLLYSHLHDTVNVLSYSCLLYTSPSPRD